jgi:NDP-sugar pyrophosphorylase family protein
MIDQALILAAGKGTRMGRLTDDCPKPLLTVAGIPIIEHVLRGLASVGIARAVMVTGYLAERMEGFLGNGARVGLHMTYRRQESQNGTAKAALLAREDLAPTAFVMSFGDILCARSNYRALLAAFAAEPCDALLGLNPVDDPWEGAAVYREGGRVSRIIEKPARGTSTTKWNNAGVMILTPGVWPVLERLEPSPRGEYELPVGIGRMVEDGFDVRGVEFAGLWSDVGRPEELARINRLAAENALDLS